MTLSMLFGLCGGLGCVFFVIGDLLLDVKGPDNRKLGKYGIMDSAWDRMDVRRFRWSILCALVGAPLSFLGTTAMAGQLAQEHPDFALAFWLSCVVGCTGSFFIHTIICLFPVVDPGYHALPDADRRGAAEAEVGLVLRRAHGHHPQPGHGHVRPAGSPEYAGLSCYKKSPEEDSSSGDFRFIRLCIPQTAPGLRWGRRGQRPWGPQPWAHRGGRPARPGTWGPPGGTGPGRGRPRRSWRCP